jgi:hypothetical protein
MLSVIPRSLQSQCVRVLQKSTSTSLPFVARNYDHNKNLPDELFSRVLFKPFLQGSRWTKNSKNCLSPTRFHPIPFLISRFGNMQRLSKLDLEIEITEYLPLWFLELTNNDHDPLSPKKWCPVSLKWWMDFDEFPFCNNFLVFVDLFVFDRLVNLELKFEKESHNVTFTSLVAIRDRCSSTLQRLVLEITIGYLVLALEFSTGFPHLKRLKIIYARYCPYPDCCYSTRDRSLEVPNSDSEEGWMAYYSRTTTLANVCSSSECCWPKLIDFRVIEKGTFSNGQHGGLQYIPGIYEKILIVSSKSLRKIQLTGFLHLPPMILSSSKMPNLRSIFFQENCPRLIGNTELGNRQLLNGIPNHITTVRFSIINTFTSGTVIENLCKGDLRFVKKLSIHNQRSSSGFSGLDIEACPFPEPKATTASQYFPFLETIIINVRSSVRLPDWPLWFERLEECSICLLKLRKIRILPRHRDFPPANLRFPRFENLSELDFSLHDPQTSMSVDKRGLTLSLLFLADAFVTCPVLGRIWFPEILQLYDRKLLRETMVSLSLNHSMFVKITADGIKRIGWKKIAKEQ